jgi:hypothetical protein
VSYAEQDNEVVLRMSREDYVEMIRAIRQLARFKVKSPQRMLQLTTLAQRLNSGNPNYTSYQTGEK